MINPEPTLRMINEIGVFKTKEIHPNCFQLQHETGSMYLRVTLYPKAFTITSGGPFRNTQKTKEFAYCESKKASKFVSKCVKDAFSFYELRNEVY